MKRKVAALTVVGSWEWDFSTGAITWSDGLFRLFGFRPGSVLPTFELWVSKVHPDDRPSSEAIALAALNSGVSIDHEFRIIRDDGTVRWLANMGEVFANASGQSSWASGAVFDITELREAQIDLAQREERYIALAAAGAICSWRAAPDGTFIDASSWGSYTGQDCRKSDWLDSVHPDDAPAVASIWEEMLRVGCALDYSFRLRHQSGEYRWMYGRAVPIKDSEGSIREWVGKLEDVHERRGTSERLRLNQQRLRLALSAGRMVTWDYDICTGWVSQSEHAEELVGIGSGHISDLEKMLHPNDIEALRIALGVTISTGAPFHCEFRVVGSHRETRWLRATGHMAATEIGAPGRILGVTVDITDRKKADLRYASDRLAIERFDALAQIAGDFVWIATPDGRVTDMPGWRSVTGQTQEEIRDWGWLCAVHPADRERVRDALLYRADGTGLTKMEYRIRSRLGNYRLIRSRAAPVRRADGSIAEWIGVCSQVAEQAFSEPTFNASDCVPAARDAEATAAYQVRAARAVLKWSVHELARRSGVSTSTIRRIESSDGKSDALERRTLRLVRSTLEEAGICFGPILGGKGGVGPA